MEPHSVHVLLCRKQAGHRLAAMIEMETYIIRGRHFKLIIGHI